VVFDPKQNFELETIEPFLKHLRENGYPTVEATMEDATLLSEGESRSTLKLETNVGYFIAQVEHLKRRSGSTHPTRMMDLNETIDFQEHLRANGIPTAPHIGKAGSYDEDHQFELTQLVQGTKADTIEQEHIKNIATQLAKLHIAGSSFFEGNDNYRKPFDRTDMECGIIHNDIHPTNILYDHNKQVAAILDFDRAEYALIAQDISRAMRDFSNDIRNDKGFIADNAQTFLETYNNTRTISEGEQKHILNTFEIAQVENSRHYVKENAAGTIDENNRALNNILKDIKLENLKDCNRSQSSGMNR
jgi:Ser/Thr protein kinase RdoA (MazF antagonist)